MEVTIITTADGRVTEAVTGYFAVKARLKTDAMIEVEKTDGTLKTIAAATITGYEQVKRATRKVGFR